MVLGATFAATNELFIGWAPTAGKRFGFFSDAFPSGYNSFLHTRYDAFIRHVHSMVIPVDLGENAILIFVP